MISYKRQIKLKNLEIFLIFKDSISMGYLIIEDTRRKLNQEELTRYPYKQMDIEEINEYKNVIKIYVLSDEELSEDNQTIFKEFAMDLVDCKDFCTLTLDFHINKKLFENLPLDNQPEDYQKILIAVKSEYDISHLNLNNLMFLSQD